MSPAVLGFLGDDVGEVGHIFYFREDSGVRQRGVVIGSGLSHMKLHTRRSDASRSL